jgi:hypothetical protein
MPACRSAFARARRALRLSTGVDEAAQAVGEEHVDLLILEDRRHLALPEDRVRQGLPRAVRVRAVVRGTGK